MESIHALVISVQYPISELQQYRHLIPTLDLISPSSNFLLFLQEVTEFKSGKNMYGGRLTSDMVTEKLGHSNYTDITYLALQSCSIR